MQAVKGNKVYKVNETNKKAYLAQGYEIQDDNGKVLETPADKSVPYADYQRVLEENKKLKAEIAKLKKVDKQ